MLGLNPRVINQLARQQAELVKTCPDGKYLHLLPSFALNTWQSTPTSSRQINSNQPNLFSTVNLRSISENLKRKF
jgi:hypothetical protein